MVLPSISSVFYPEKKQFCETGCTLLQTGVICKVYWGQSHLQPAKRSQTVLGGSSHLPISNLTWLVSLLSRVSFVVNGL